MADFQRRLSRAPSLPPSSSSYLVQVAVPAANHRGRGRGDYLSVLFFTSELNCPRTCDDFPFRREGDARAPGVFGRFFPRPFLTLGVARRLSYFCIRIYFRLDERRRPRNSSGDRRNPRIDETGKLSNIRPHIDPFSIFDFQFARISSILRASLCERFSAFNCRARCTRKRTFITCAMKRIRHDKRVRCVIPRESEFIMP